mmetsp:Transcript_2296/g.3137  ORF Transcript_2296/g.3137 Transcript_2296/m.3137 type:complete len:337 (+) Transcript_2296:119-1129(+)
MFINSTSFSSNERDNNDCLILNLSCRFNKAANLVMISKYRSCCPSAVLNAASSTLAAAPRFSSTPNSTCTALLRAVLVFTCSHSSPLSLSKSSLLTGAGSSGGGLAGGGFRGRGESEGPGPGGGAEGVASSEVMGFWAAARLIQPCRRSRALSRTALAGCFLSEDTSLTRSPTSNSHTCTRRAAMRSRHRRAPGSSKEPSRLRLSCSASPTSRSLRDSGLLGTASLTGAFFFSGPFLGGGLLFLARGFSSSSSSSSSRAAGFFLLLWAPFPLETLLSSSSASSSSSSLGSSSSSKASSSSRIFCRVWSASTSSTSSGSSLFDFLDFLSLFSSPSSA